MHLPEECYIFGYGSEEFTGDATLELRIGPIDIISQEECESDLGQYMAPERGSGMFCAIGKSSGGLVDACQVCCQFNYLFVVFARISSYLWRRVKKILYIFIKSRNFEKKQF